MSRWLVVALLALPLTTASASAQRVPSDQRVASDEARAGRIMQLGDILSIVTPRVGGTLIGSSYDAETRTYQLRYMRGADVVNVSVDARDGRLLRRQSF